MSCRHTSMALLVLALALGLGVSSAAPGSAKVEAIRGLDVYAVSDTALVPGSRAAVRVVVRAVTGLVDSKPLPMARVNVILKSDKRAAKRLFSGRADVLGNLQADFRVPDWPDGSYQMTVSVRSPVGKGETSQTVQLKRTGRVLLVTDKPIYQPGQEIQLRALALQAHGLAPMAKEALRFEILDPKGNKVFKRELTTGDYGVASVRFQLADEVNQGPYQIEVNPVRKGAAETASKTVVVKKYVLPKFKVGLTTERDYYLPKQTVKGSIQADYFFGKPVAGGEVEIKASTFDVAFKEFATLRGRTDEKGAWEFELKLPDYFVGQPLQKGDAVVKLEAKVVDTAKHPQKAIKSVPVAADPIRLDAVPEAGRLVPGVENRLFVVATYPDGSPARAEVAATRDEKPIGKVRTDESGLGVIRFTPDAAHLSPAAAQQPGRFLGGRNVRPGPTGGQLAINFSVRDKAGRSCKVNKQFSTAPADQSILLRTDKAIYQAGDVLKATVLSPNSGACYLDVIKDRQTLMTKSLVLDGGRGQLKLPLSPDAFGSLELHAYRIAADGEIIRDARVLYVQPPRQLEVTVARDKPVYRPGEQAKIRFQVADRSGKPRPAALGVIIVDEAVYALQELQPGLEKVYFTLEKELASPKAQIEFGPAASMASLIQADKVEARRQRVAQVLLAKAEPAATPGLWVNPLAERKQKAEQDRYAIANALARYGREHALGRHTKAGRWAYRSGLVAAMKKAKVLPDKHYLDPLGAPYTMRAVETLWPELRAGQYLGATELNRLWQLRNLLYGEVHRRTEGFSLKKVGGLARHMEQAFTSIVRKQPEVAKDLAGKTYKWRWLRRKPGFRQQDFAANIHAGRVQNIYYSLSRYGQESQRWYRVNVLDKKTNSYKLPADVLGRVVKRGLLSAQFARDIWGHKFRLRKRKKPREQVTYDHRLRFYEVYSVGPDGKAGTADDLVYDKPWLDGGYRALAEALGVDPNQPMTGGGFAVDGALLGALGTRGRGGGGMGGMRRGGARFKAAGMAQAAPPMDMLEEQKPRAAERTTAIPRDEAKGPAAPKKRQVRVRNFFPETLLFAPALITDEKGRAELELTVADSITTWRMTAMANGRGGGLGSTSHGIRVFQDFFVDLDLPVALTQNDEVSVPVVVYNYLKGPQRVRLELTAGDWFELTGPAVQEIQLEPNEVQATYYRLKVSGLGKRTLQVRADGSSMSDAIRRDIEVLPDGKEFNQVANGRLEGSIEQTVRIPDDAVAGASKILVRLYPGVFSQVIEGMESMLRLPGG